MIYYVLLRKHRTGQNVFLFFASLIFYAFGEPKFVYVMVFSILMNWGWGLAVDKFRDNKSKAYLVLAGMVVSNVSILFIFKYLMFTVNVANNLGLLSITVPNIALPIGISFFTFQAMSYVIDVYRKSGEVQKNPMNVGLYIAFFPQLIAGPIVRYETVAEQICNRKENWTDFSNGVVRFIIGFSKKILLSNTMAVVADYAFGVFSGPERMTSASVLMAWCGAIAYTLQIYYDFSGYSDMAIGLGKMFGFHFNENFNYPYISRSVSEFWRRWHISLGTWFKDYVYFPLGGSRVESKGRLIFNLFVVWLLTGIWHGANWTFICWGLLYFVLLVMERLSKINKNKSWFGNIYTLFFVVLGWVLFRAENLGVAFDYMKAMFGLGVSRMYDPKTIFYIKENIFFFVAGIVLSAPVLSEAKNRVKVNACIWNVLETISLLVLFVVSISYLVKGAYNPFIYFNF